MLHRDEYGDRYGNGGGDGKQLNLKFIDTGTAWVRLYIYVYIYIYMYIYKCVYTYVHYVHETNQILSNINIV